MCEEADDDHKPQDSGKDQPGQPSADANGAAAHHDEGQPVEPSKDSEDADALRARIRSLLSSAGWLANSPWLEQSRALKQYLDQTRALSDYVARVSEDRNMLLKAVRQSFLTSGTGPSAAEEKKFHKQIEELQRKEKVSHVAARVHPQLYERLIDEPEYANQFLEGEQFACVLSVDIRRSTELMLKARTPDGFAIFMTELASQMHRAVVDNFGIFDKFTGDGILAFFPSSYSGTHAARHCVAAAHECHRCFDEVYKLHRSAFTSVLLDVGLGVGIDAGSVQFR